MSQVIPIFPLPNVVFLPETRLPLHIFESRYRQMVADAMTADRTIGMALLRPGGASSQPPPIFEYGCAGEIIDCDALADGRYDIVLEGRFRYRVRHELRHEPYRLAEVESAPVQSLSRDGEGRRLARGALAQALERLAITFGNEPASQLPATLSDEGLVNEAAMRLGLEVPDRYRLLAMNGLEERYAWVLAYMEMVQTRVDTLAPYRGLQKEPRWN